MQSFTRIEVQWMMLAINHYIAELEETMELEKSAAAEGLCSLRRSHLLDIHSKLETALENHEKRIEITY